MHLDNDKFVRYVPVSIVGVRWHNTKASLVEKRCTKKSVKVHCPRFVSLIFSNSTGMG